MIDLQKTQPIALKNLKLNAGSYVLEQDNQVLA